MLSLGCGVLMLCLQIAPLADIASVLLDSGVITLPHLIGPEPSTDQSSSANTTLWMLMCAAVLVVVVGGVAVLAWHSWSARQLAWEDDPYDRWARVPKDQDANPFL